MWRPNYYIRYIFLPHTVDGVTLPNDDGSFDIYINTAIPESRQTKKLQHELNHINNDHFYRDLPIYVVESDAGSDAVVAQFVERNLVRADNIKSGDDTKIIPLFSSLDQFTDFYQKLINNGRCGDYVLVQTVK